MTKFEECTFQACDALNEAAKWFRANEHYEAASELRRAERELSAARAVIGAGGQAPAATQSTPRQATLITVALRAIVDETKDYPATPPHCADSYLPPYLIQQAQDALASAPPRIGEHWPEQGGIYAGIARGADGAPDHHLVLLPGEAAPIEWHAACAWAKNAGGELPTRREQALLYANLPEEFKRDWYWSGEQDAANSDYAWEQDFGNGYQSGYHESGEYRARAVRRLPIQ